MVYRTGPLPKDTKLLGAYAEEQLTEVSENLDTINNLALVELNAEPVRPREGMVVLADGTNWDPGAGGGFYGYIGASWLPLSGAAPAYTTRNGITSINIPSAVVIIHTTGYATAGDGGGATYKQVGSEPPHALKVQSADGAFWELVPEGGVVRAKQAGAVEGADVTSAIQDCINFAIYGGASGAAAASIVLIDVRDGNLTDTLHVSYGRYSGSTHLAQIVIRGLGMRHGLGDKNAGTLLQSTVTDKPGIAVTGGRNVLLEEFALWGVARADIVALATTGTIPTVEANWDAKLTTAGVTAGARYAPHAGIAIDAYVGTAPGSAYPNVTFPSWIDASPVQYGKDASSFTTIHRVQLEGWEVAVVATPADHSGNGDFLQLEQVKIESCKIGVSDGQSQSRDVRMASPAFTQVFTCLTNNTHGKQVGSFGGEIIDFSGAQYIGRIFDFSSLQNVIGITFRGLYCESLHRIGDFSGSGSTEGQLLFDNCVFQFRHNSKGVSPANIISGSKSEVVFKGGGFQGYNDCLMFDVVAIRIEGTRANPENTSTKTYMQIFHNATQGGLVMTRLGTPLTIVAARFQPYELSGGSLKGTSYTTGETFSWTDRDHLLPIWAPACARFDATVGLYPRDLVRNPRQQNSDNSATKWASTSRTNRTIAFTTTAAPPNDQGYHQGGYMPGDFIVDEDTGSVMVIRSTNTSTGVIAAELVSNWVDDGGSSFSTFETLSLTAGIKAHNLSRVYTPPRRIVGDVATANATILAIPTMRGSTPTDYGLAANDWLYEDAMEPTTYSTTGRALVSGITTASNLITMTGNGSQALTQIPFDWWVKDSPTNDGSR